MEERFPVGTRVRVANGGLGNERLKANEAVGAFVGRVITLAEKSWQNDWSIPGALIEADNGERRGILVGDLELACSYGCDEAPVTHTVKTGRGIQGMCAEHAEAYGYPQYLVRVGEYMTEYEMRQSYEAAEVEARAKGEIIDPVPVGSDKATVSAFGGVQSPIVRAERLFKSGHMTEVKFRAIVNEVARLTRRKAERACIEHAKEALRQFREKLITEAYMGRMIDEACDIRDGVSLRKR